MWAGLENSPAREKLLPPTLEKVGFISTRENVMEVRVMQLASMVLCDITVSAQDTRLHSPLLEGVPNMSHVCLQTGYASTTFYHRWLQMVSDFICETDPPSLWLLLLLQSQSRLRPRKGQKNWTRAGDSASLTKH